MSNARQLREGKKMLENSINQIKNNLQKLGLDLTSKKTTFVHKKILPGSTELTIDNNNIKSSKSVRFLGLFLGYNMSFTTHINIIQQRCSKALNIIKYLRGTVGMSSQNFTNPLQKFCSIHRRLL